MKIISGHIRIEDYKVWKNDKLIFSYEDQDGLNKFLKALYKDLGLKYMKYFKMDSLSKMGLLATELLIQENSLGDKYEAEQIGLVLANASASLDTDRKYYDTIKDKDEYYPSPALFVYTLPNIVIGEICIKNNFKGENTFFIQENFDSDFMCTYAENLLENTSQKALICGWLDFDESHHKGILYIVENEGEGLPLTPESINSLFLK